MFFGGRSRFSITFASLGAKKSLDRGFCIIYHLEMRSEVYQERPLVLLARFGIFLPPLLVAAFTSFIQPVPPDYQLILNSADSRNPRHTRPAAQCVAPRRRRKGCKRAP